MPSTCVRGLRDISPHFDHFEHCACSCVSISAQVSYGLTAAHLWKFVAQNKKRRAQGLHAVKLRPRPPAVHLQRTLGRLEPHSYAEREGSTIIEIDTTPKTAPTATERLFNSCKDDGMPRRQYLEKTKITVSSGWRR